ncbi:pentapeptide repeat-containing protein [Nostoc sp. ATCC 53789]|uniref:pentapeptide repeat-containing protein n=1 Tax=Nostoc sp. ATCC 53789 TaxID=76335 RepID=UPI000DED2127|nr:pentapeptide repeat-containing protein [Nostoc sp. ATCC 53789]QHG21079.1 hypothetical protein GJB62_35100 [Nostoc sp. ATCC 53789]RCJ33747.1 hypothetical protein A6V25_34455 [Nostoc sp. ATCC 53789]
MPSIEELKESFTRIYDGVNKLKKEYDLLTEAYRLNIPLDIYIRLYELRNEEEIEPYPKLKHWRQFPQRWGIWFIHLPKNKKIFLLKKALFKVVESGILITIIIGLINYIRESPIRQKQAHYQAWQVINSALGQQGSGGRIEAIQDLNKDGVSLESLTANNANLDKIRLNNAYLLSAKLKNASIRDANLQKAKLRYADLRKTALIRTNLQEANLSSAILQSALLDNANLYNADLTYSCLRDIHLNGTNLKNADLTGADMRGAHFALEYFNENEQLIKVEKVILDGANLDGADLREAKLLTIDIVKSAHNWEKAHYDSDIRKKLGLPPEELKDKKGLCEVLLKIAD